MDMRIRVFTWAILGLVVCSVTKGDLVEDLLDELVGSIGKSGYQDQYEEPVYGYPPEEPHYGYSAPSPPPSYGYKQTESYEYNSAPTYSYQAPHSPPTYGYSPPASYYSRVNELGYGKQSGYSSPPQGYSPPAPTGYSPPAETAYSPPTHQGYAPPMKNQRYKKKPKKERVYIPIRVRKQKKKKMKIITVQKGFYIAGGTQLFGKYKSLKSCQKACAATPTCFSGDYNPWLKKCYIHSNFTACGTLKAHKKLVHFKKVPCVFPESPLGRVILGVQISGGIEQKGIKGLSDCVKKCANTGKGIPATADTMLLVQRCFGVDYDFGTHKCFFHTNNIIPLGQFCPLAGTAPTVPRDTIPNPAVVTILLCPGAHTNPAG